MSLNTISVPAVSINDQRWPLVSNSLTYDGGELEINVRTASTGGGARESVHSQNAEGGNSKITFSVYLTPDLDSKIAEWKENVGGNVIKFSEKVANSDSVARTFPGMSLINRVERAASSDGAVSLEFAGDPMVIG